MKVLRGKELSGQQDFAEERPKLDFRELEKPG